MNPLMLAMMMQSMGGGQSGGGLSSILGNLFNNPADAYQEAQDAYAPWAQKSSDVYNPFYQKGVESQGKLGNWLDQMKNPSDFINNLMGGYQQSPHAKYLQDYIGHSGTNAASAAGTIGSTPYLQESQKNAGNIASGDMNNWLSHVLGINSQYGQGLAGLTGQGFNAAQGMSGAFGQRAGDEANLAYGREGANQSRSNGLIGGILNMFGF